MKNQTQHSILLLFPIHHFVFQMNKDNVMLYFRFVLIFCENGVELSTVQ